MDKYEYKLKLDQIKALASEQKYEEAATIIDSINWRKVRNVNSLVKAGEIYAQVGRYDDGKGILLMAYDRSPIGRMIIYRLAEIAIKTENFEEAQEYYDEFVEIAPHDNLKYVLRYEINKAKGAEVEVLAGILKELKEQEYSEKWAFELAYLYHNAGKIEACIEACDELILWFGDGPYVEKALELKMLYQPLNKTQEEKYRAFKQKRDGIVEIRPSDFLESGEIVHETVQIPQVTTNASRFNTVNLQAELAKSMQQIMDATEKETVTDTMDSIKRIVEDIPYLQIPHVEEETPKNIEKYGYIETDEEIDDSLKINFQEMLAEDYDGQISLMMPERAALEAQITGQMSIDEILEEWEKTKRAAESALQEAELRKLESAKAKALQEAGDIMERLSDVIPQLEAGYSPKDLLEQEYLGKILPPGEEAGQLMANMNNILQEQIDSISRVNAGIDEFLAQEGNIELGLEDSLTIEEEELPKIQLEPEAMESVIEQASESENTTAQKLPEVAMPDFAEEGIDDDEAPITSLNPKQRELFSYFVPVIGMEEQLCQVLTGAKKRLMHTPNASAGNIIIQGVRGSGKTVLATSLIKALQKEVGCLNSKVGKIDAVSLNQKDIPILLKKIAGGCLIIEKAGDLSRETAIKLSLAMENCTDGLLVIMEDNKAGIVKALGRDESFSRKFTEKISLPVFTSDELVAFAKSYANELLYDIDDMGILALYKKISNIQKVDQATTLSEVKEIVDDAIANAEKVSIKKAFSRLATKKHHGNDKVMLYEKDFEE